MFIPFCYSLFCITHFIQHVCFKWYILYFRGIKFNCLINVAKSLIIISHFIVTLCNASKVHVVCIFPLCFFIKWDSFLIFFIMLMHYTNTVRPVSIVWILCTLNLHLCFKHSESRFLQVLHKCKCFIVPIDRQSLYNIVSSFCPLFFANICFCTERICRRVVIIHVCDKVKLFDGFIPLFLCITVSSDTHISHDPTLIKLYYLFVIIVG